MITVEEALARVLASAETPLEEEKIALKQVTAGCSRATSRRFGPSRRSPTRPWTAMRCARPTPRTAPATLTVIGESAAGRAFEGALGPGQAVRIFTGAPMPDGADAIVIQEDVRARATGSGSRPPPPPATICARRAWTFAPAKP